MKKKYCKFYKRHLNGRGTCSSLKIFGPVSTRTPKDRCLFQGELCRDPELCEAFEKNIKEIRKDKLKKINGI